eukprot:5859703-Amphidinium_carterae.1
MTSACLNLYDLTESHTKAIKISAGALNHARSQPWQTTESRQAPKSYTLKTPHIKDDKDFLRRAPSVGKSREEDP